MMSRCDLHEADIDRRGCPWCQLDDALERIEKWKTWHDAASEDAKKWRRDAQELQGENEQLHESLSAACFERNLAQIEVQTLKEALHKISDCDECDPEISISLLQLIAREATLKE